MDQGLNGATIVNAGGMVVEVLIEGGATGALTQAEHTAWVTEHDIEVTTVMALDTQTEIALQGREQAYIVDTRNMQIVWRQTGNQFDGGEANSSVYAGLTRMMQLLP